MWGSRRTETMAPTNVREETPVPPEPIMDPNVAINNKIEAAIAFYNAAAKNIGGNDDPPAKHKKKKQIKVKVEPGVFAADICGSGSAKKKKEIKVKIEPGTERSVKDLVAAVKAKDADTVKMYRKLIRVGVKAENAKAKRKHHPYKKNQWNIHLDSFRVKHPDMPFGECLIAAKATYQYKKK
jgi:hypothetical protein